MTIHEIGFIVLGFGSCLGVQIGLSLVRRLYGLATKAHTAEAQRDEVQKRLERVQDELRLLECAQAAKRVNVRPR